MGKERERERGDPVGIVFLAGGGEFGPVVPQGRIYLVGERRGWLEGFSFVRSRSVLEEFEVTLWCAVFVR